MIFLRRSEHLPIAIDIGHDNLKLLQLQERSGVLSVVAAAQQAVECEDLTGLDRTAYAMPLIKQMLQQSGFRSRRIVPVLPREFVQVKTLRLPPLPESDMKLAIENETRTLFSVPSEQLSIRFIPAGEVRQGTESRQEVIVLAVETRLIDSLLEQFNQVGLIVDALDFEPCAAYRGIERFVRRKEDEVEVNVLVDIGAEQSQVVIGRGRDVTFVKSIEIGSRKINECVSRKLSLSLSEAASLRRRFGAMDASEKDPVRQTVSDATRSMISDLVHEISLCLRYYSVTFRGQRPAKICVMGGDANDPTIIMALTQGMTVPVTVCRPFQGVLRTGTMLDLPDATHSEWAVAFGASLRMAKSMLKRGSDATFSPYGRRKSDTSMVEVVDLGSEIKSAGVMEAPDPQRNRLSAQEVANA